MKLTIRMGLFCVVAMNIVNRFADIPFLSGLLAGAGVCLFIMGMLPQKTADALKNWKRAVFHRT